jgi:hypothetical protein
MFVNIHTLGRLDACYDYRDAFDVLFPNGTLVTPELCVQHSDSFEWGWAVEELLSSDGQRRFWQTFDPENNPEVAALDRRREEIHEDWRAFVNDWSARHGVSADRMYWRDRVAPNVAHEYDQRLNARADAHTDVQRHLDRIRAQIFGELAGAYEANRVRWATEETRLDELFDTEAYCTTKTPTTAPTPSFNPEKKDQGESIT